MSEVLIYEAENGQTRVDVRLEAETVWLTQRQLAELLDTSTDNISLHLKNIFTDGELDEVATTEDFSVVQKEGSRTVSRRLKHYNLDAIISVGYRVNSKRGVQFRQWATRVLREHLVQGYTLKKVLNKSAHRRRPVSSLLKKLDSGLRRNDVSVLNMQAGTVI